jgi:hypothetical protein
VAALDRSYWLAVGPVAYVGVANLESGGITPLRLAAFVAAPLVLAVIFRVTEVGNSERDSAPLKAARVAITAALVWLQSRTAGPGGPALELAATLAAGTCNVAAVFGQARIPRGSGLVTPPAATRSLDATAFAGFIWATALVLALARFVAPSTLRLDPLTVDYANTAASIGGLLVLIAAAWRVQALRSLELGVADRAAGALALAVSALAVAVPAAAANIAAPDRVLPAAGILAALGSLWTALIREPARVSSVLRVTMALLLMGVPVALVSGILAAQRPALGGVVALAGCAVSMLVGLFARSAAAPLGPVQSRWLNAVTLASERALIPEPNAAIVATLGALKRAFSSARAAPQLWRLDPPAVLSIDVAGYLSEQSVEIPEALCALAMGEPEQTLRVETLRALEVRRPEIRPLLAWLEARDIFCATTILDEDGPMGFLLMPRAGRRTLLTLEEAQLLRRLGTRISGLLAVTSSLARARERELEATQRATRWQREYERTRIVVDGQRQRNRGFSQNLARPLLGTCYSAASRLALARVQELAATPEPILLEVPVGSNPLPWAAVAHLASNQGDGAFVYVDGGTESAGGADRFGATANSPVALAEGGTLFVQDLHLLPTDSQLVLLDCLTRKVDSAHSIASALPSVRLIASIRQPLAELYSHGHIQRPFEPLFANRRVALPTLSERSEDIRAIVIEVLSRTAAGPDNQPLGIARGALQILLDHDWPGNETELMDVLGRASQLESGLVLSPVALAQAGFQPTAHLARTPSVWVPELEPQPVEGLQPTRSPTPPPQPRRRPRAPRSRRPRT